MHNFFAVYKITVKVTIAIFFGSSKQESEMLCNCCEFVFFYFKEKIRKFVTDSFACLLLEADTAALGALMASYPCGAVLFLPELVRDCSW